MSASVTGPGGFVAGHLLRRLASDGVVIDDGRPGIIFHLGAQSSVQRSVEDPLFDVSSNVLGTVMQLERARMTGARFVYTASGGTEQDPESPYAISKDTGARYCRWYMKAHGLQVTILHLQNIYGPGGRSALDLMLAHPDDFVVNGTGEQRRRWTHVDAVVDACILALEANVAYEGDFDVPSEEASLNELFAMTGIKPRGYGPPLANESRWAFQPDGRPVLGMAISLPNGIAEY